MAKFEYEVLVGINYPPNKRAEAGDIVSDLPKDSIPSLMDAGIIKAAGNKKPAVFKADAIDADGDGMVQDGTIFERPATKVVEAEVSDEL
jgi:hypothetical protein